MASVNRVVIIGNLGRDPEVRYNPNGGAWCTVSIATTRNWKDKTSGEKMEETEWHRVVFNDRLAEIAGEYLKKGRSVYVEGRLKTRKWTDKDGVEKFATEIIANEMQMLGGREDSGGGSDDGSSQRRQSPPAARAPAPAPRGGGAPTRQPAKAGFDDVDDSDDIPFATSDFELDMDRGPAKRMRKYHFK